MNYFLYQDDIPSNIKFGDIVAIDTETMGLNLQRDRLCLIQLSNGDGNAHLIQISKVVCLYFVLSNKLIMAIATSSTKTG